MSLLRGVSFGHLNRTREFVLAGCFVRAKEEVVLVLRAGNEQTPAFLNAYRAIDAATPIADMTAKEAFEALLPAFAEHLVIGWKNVLAEDGRAAPSTKENILEVMTAYAAEALDLACEPLFYALKTNNFRDYKPDADAVGKE